MPTTLTDPGGDPQLPGRKAASSKLGQRAANSDGKGRRGKGAAGWMDGGEGAREGGGDRRQAGRRRERKAETQGEPGRGQGQSPPQPTVGSRSRNSALASARQISD